jgi:tRNA threonylcarbamoyladenosine biosynthesis protein TsaB
MRVLALETSGSTGAVALLDGARPVVELPLPAAQRSARSLAPTIQQLLRESHVSPAELQLIAVTTGPGSFTSLRIGLATAKALAYALGAEVQGVNTLEAIAQQVPGGPPRVKVVVDAQRNELFAATIERDAAGQIVPGWQTAVVDNQRWLDELQPGDVVVGPGLSRLADRLPAGVTVVEQALWMPSAIVVGQLGFAQYAAGRRDDVFQLVPQYFRRTAAEEQWQRRQQPAG